MNNDRGLSEEQWVTSWTRTAEPTSCFVTLNIFPLLSALAASLALHPSSLFRGEPVPIRRLYNPSIVTNKPQYSDKVLPKLPLNFSVLLMLFIRLVCKPSTAALVISRVHPGQINTLCSAAGPASPAPTVPSKTKYLQQDLLEKKPFLCHQCHNSAQLIYCFLSPSLQFHSVIVGWL